MMQDFGFFMQTQIIFGNGKINQTGELLGSYGAHRAIIVTDKNVATTQVFDAVISSIHDKGVETVVYMDVLPDPTTSNAEEAGLFARNHNADAVVGLGGGSSMDIAKAVSLMLTNEGGIRDIMKPNKIQNNPKPLICIPTTAGTGSEVTSFAVLTIEEENRKGSIYDEKARPKAAICDPNVLLSVPPHVAAATGIDALTHAIEAYTCKAANEITDGMARQSIRLISQNLTEFVHNNTDKSRRNMMLGSLIAGIAFGFSDIAGVHCMAEALGGLCHVPHGVANSMFLSYVFEFNIPANVKKHRDIAVEMGIDAIGKSDREVAQAAADWLRTLADDVGIQKFSNLSAITPDFFEPLADLCMKNVSLPSNPRRLTKEDFIRLYEKAYNAK